MITIRPIPLFASAFWMALCLIVSSQQTAAAAPVQATLFAAPSGTGSGTSAQDPCSLEKARDLVRALNPHMSGDIIVNLRGGTYWLKTPFRLEESSSTHDSGTGGFNIIYQAYPGETPILSGGIPITGWTVFDASKNIYRASVPKGVKSRQFFVNDLRAERARGPLMPTGWTKTATGWTITDPTMQNWRNISEIEIVSRSSWKHLRCDIASINGLDVTMKTPGWFNCSKSPHPGNPFNGGGTQEMRKVEWVENAFELLSQPGQWYLDSPAGYIYYIPRADEDVHSVPAVLPVLETLLDVHGTSFTQRIHNVVIKGLTFKYGTWMFPSGDQGYADNQAGVVWVNVPPTSLKTPGNVAVEYSQNIRFEQNTICHMGGAGLDFGHGPQDDVIQGNCIYDVSGNGLFIGEVDDYQATDPNAWADRDTIKDNLVKNVAVEYEDQIAICTGYVRHLLLDHNEVGNLPYSGISVGWGWSKQGYSYNNTITNNLVYNYMRILGDGGGIYTLGNQGDAQNETVWSGNFIHNAKGAQGLYADEGSGFMDIKNNVVTNIGRSWIYMWTKSIHDIHVHDNFSDRTNMTAHGTDCLVENNDMTIKPEQLPDSAQAIVKNAGLEPEFAKIRDRIPLPPIEMIDDTDPAIVYSGAWSASGNRKAGDYLDDVHATGQDGDSASFTFTGAEIQYLTEVNHDEGAVDVYIDGALVKTVDCSAPNRQGQQNLFEQAWPQAGQHTIKIVKKSGSFMILDAFKIWHQAKMKSGV